MQSISLANVLIQFVTVVLGSGIAVAAMQHWFEAGRIQKKLSEQTSFLALKLAFFFEEYAIRCADAISENEDAYEEWRNNRRRLAEIPLLAALPTDEAYRYLNESILQSVFDFPQKRDLAAKLSSGLFEASGDHDVYCESLFECTVDLAKTAIELSADLRTQYGFGPRELKYDTWNINERIEHHHSEILKRNQRSPD